MGEGPASSFFRRCVCQGAAFPAAAFSFRCHPEAVRAKRGWVRDLLLLSFAVACVKVCVLPFLPLFAFVILKGCDFPDSLRKVTLKTICRARKPPFRNCVTPSLFAVFAPKYQHRHRSRRRQPPSERRGFQPRQKAERAAPTARGAVPASLLLVAATSH